MRKPNSDSHWPLVGDVPTLPHSRSLKGKMINWGSNQGKSTIHLSERLAGKFVEWEIPLEFPLVFLSIILK